MRDELSLPEWLSGAVVSTNLLVGGPSSGLPFHRHAETWQLQVVGRKAWYLVPPGRLAGRLADAVGPYLYPADAWADAVRGKRLGERPLRCVQYPGEILFFPASWWHATQNLDALTLAYGEKPRGRTAASTRAASDSPQPRVDVLRGGAEAAYAAMVVANFSAREPRGSATLAWYDLRGRLREVERRLREGGTAATLQQHGPSQRAASNAAIATAVAPLQHLLDVMHAAASTDGAHALLRETAAFAHCVVAGAVERQKVAERLLARDSNRSADVTARGAGHHAHSALASMLTEWRRRAADLHRGACTLQCSPCPLDMDSASDMASN